jgi:glycosyltransferase involved in cell wall biosynthesis
MKADLNHRPSSTSLPGKPLVSIVITAYNAERYIGACIKAALAQTYPNFEVVIVDDGSTDGTAQICRSITDPRVRYLTWGRLGRPKALNAGIAEAKGAYIAINDADDLSLPYRLGYAMEFFMKHPDVAIIGTGFHETREFLDRVPGTLAGESRTLDSKPPMWLSRTTVFRRNLFVNSTVIYPKSTWERIGGYDEHLGITEDYDFDLRALQCGSAALLPGRTVLWFTSPTSFFKQKSMQENLRALRFIKRRAHRLLNLPLWLRWYQPLWEVALHASQRFPVILSIANGVRKTAGREYGP